MTSSLCTGDQTSDVVPSGLTSLSLVDDTQSVTRVRAEPHTHRAAPANRGPGLCCSDSVRATHSEAHGLERRQPSAQN